MEIILRREFYTPDSTIGVLSYGNGNSCFTLEDVVRDKNRDGDLQDSGEEKVWGKTAIPSGTYEVAITWSNRFKKPLPLLFNVKGFEGIRIHPGNTSAHTHGCILLGQKRAENMIINSRIAFAAFYNWLQDALKKDKVFIKIIDK